MTETFCVHALKTRILVTGDDLVEVLVESAQESTAVKFHDGDVVVIAETALATVEGAVDKSAGVDEEGTVADGSFCQARIRS